MKLCLAIFGALLLLQSAPLRGQDPASPDPKERARTARDLADQGSVAIPTLESLLRDPEPEVRLAAVQSIVKIGTQRSLDPLVLATRDADPQVQMAATDGLVNFYLPGYVKTGITAPFRKAGSSIKGRFTDTNDQVVPANMEIRPDIVEAVGKLARGGWSMESRATAARATGIFRAAAAVPDLVEATRSKNTEVIYEALIALQKIRDKSAGPQIAFLLGDLDEDVQIAAIETTGLLQNFDALPRLYKVLYETRSKKVRRAALTSIAMMPREENRTYYNQFIQNKDTDLRAAAAEGFGRLANPADVKMMEAYFQSEKKMEPRLSMAFALVKMGQTELTEFSPLRYLINTLNSSSYNGVARPFLVELAREDAVRESIHQALPGATTQEKLHLAAVLGASGDASSVPHLETLSRDPDPQVGMEAVRALQILRARVD